MFYKFITNTDLADTEPVVLEEITELGLSWVQPRDPGIQQMSLAGKLVYLEI